MASPARRQRRLGRQPTSLQTALNAKNLTVLDYTPAIDTNAFVVRAETADQFNLTKMSDTAAVQDQLKWGLATDCPTNPLCGAPGGALEQYGITQQNDRRSHAAVAHATRPWPMRSRTRPSTSPSCARRSPTSSSTAGSSSRTTSTPSRPTTSRRSCATTTWPRYDKAAFEKILNDVSAKIDTPTLADLYKQVAVDQKDPKDVAAAWLKANGFIK